MISNHLYSWINWENWGGTNINENNGGFQKIIIGNHSSMSLFHLPIKEFPEKNDHRVYRNITPKPLHEV